MMVLDWVHIKTDIPEQGRTFERSATAEECHAVAAALDIPGCSRLETRYDVRPQPGGRYRVHGWIKAAVTLACVVSLEPLPEMVDEEFDVSFRPAADVEPDSNAEREILTEPEIEPLVDGRIEIGRVVYEIVAAAIDPYPRKDGAEFEWSDDKPDEKEPSPFAVLSKFKSKQ